MIWQLKTRPWFSPACGDIIAGYPMRISAQYGGGISSGNAWKGCVPEGNGRRENSPVAGARDFRRKWRREYTLDYSTLLRDEISYARKSAANFFTLDYWRILRDFPL